MKRVALIALLLLVAPAANAADNIGGCGWGSKLFDGQKGIAPQVLAATTNATSGNQTFGISSGTSGCTQDGVVRSSWKTAMFIDGNKSKLASDVSRGNGESLEALSSLIGIDSTDKALFFSAAKANFDNLFPRSDTRADEVVSALHRMLAGNAQLAKYAANL